MSADTLTEKIEEYVRFMADEGKQVDVTMSDVAEFRNASNAEAASCNERPRGNTGKTKICSESIDNLESIATMISGCTKCSLHQSRNKTVPGQGCQSPDIMFIGEAPGADEDRQGKAFVGRAGQLLTKMIEAMGYRREQVFIGNILKCRPPGNRKPLPVEMETCMPYLKRQINVLQPKVIITLGGTAAEGLFDVNTGITRLRGKWLSFEGIDVMPTYHPAYLLRNPAAKRETWQDLQAALRRLGRPIPGK